MKTEYYFTNGVVGFTTSEVGFDIGYTTNVDKWEKFDKNTMKRCEKTHTAPFGGEWPSDLFSFVQVDHHELFLSKNQKSALVECVEHSKRRWNGRKQWKNEQKTQTPFFIAGDRVRLNFGHRLCGTIIGIEAPKVIDDSNSVQYECRWDSVELRTEWVTCADLEKI